MKLANTFERWVGVGRRTSERYWRLKYLFAVLIYLDTVASKVSFLDCLLFFLEAIDTAFDYTEMVMARQF